MYFIDTYSFFFTYIYDLAMTRSTHSPLYFFFSRVSFSPLFSLTPHYEHIGNSTTRLCTAEQQRFPVATSTMMIKMNWWIVKWKQRKVRFHIETDLKFEGYDHFFYYGDLKLIYNLHVHLNFFNT